MQVINQKPHVFRRSSVEAGQPEVGQVMLQQNHFVSHSAEPLPGQLRNDRQFEEYAGEVSRQRLLNDVVVLMVEIDCFQYAVPFPHQFVQRLPPFVQRRNRPVRQNQDNVQAPGVFHGGRADRQPAVFAAQEETILDQLLHGAPGGHVADPERVRELPLGRHLLDQVVTIPDLPLDRLRDLEIFCIHEITYSKFELYQFCYIL